VPYALSAVLPGCKPANQLISALRRHGAASRLAMWSQGVRLPYTLFVGGRQIRAYHECESRARFRADDIPHPTSKAKLERELDNTASS
jgi:hypothetical protein